MMAVGQADVETVIALSGLTLEQGLDRLKTVGITDVEGMTMPALTQGDQSVQDKVIQALFDEERLAMELKAPSHHFTITSSLTNILAQARSIRSGDIWYGMPSNSQIAIIWSIRNTG